MKTKRLLALLLVICMSVAALASCASGDDDETGVDTESSTPSDDSNMNFKQADYGGDAFSFITFTSDVNGNEYYCGEWIDCDSIVGVATSDAVYKRNMLCEQKYNVKIDNVVKEGGYEEYQNLVLKGDQYYDVVYGWAQRLATGVIDGAFYDFKNLDDKGYIDLEADYWNPSVNESLTVADRLFVATNDVTMAPLSWTGCIFFNPQIVEDYGLDNPHDLVDANEWTVDKFLEMVSAVHGDLDGNPDFTIEDCYGLIDFGSTGALLTGSGVTLVDEYDSLNIGSERVFNLITKIHGVLDNKAYVFGYGDDYPEKDQASDPWEYVRSYFANGHSLFLNGTPEITREFRNMETGYGIVPNPKFDSSQTSYISGIDQNAGAFALPIFIRRDVSSASRERTGTILEYLSYKSSEDISGSVLNEYYETTIKSQRQTIDKNKEMLDKYIKDSGHYEWAEVYHVGAANGDEAKSIAGVLGEMAKSGKALQSTYRKSQNRLQKAIDDTITTIEGIKNDDAE